MNSKITKSKSKQVLPKNKQFDQVESTDQPVQVNQLIPEQVENVVNVEQLPVSHVEESVPLVEKSVNVQMGGNNPKTKNKVIKNENQKSNQTKSVIDKKLVKNDTTKSKGKGKGKGNKTIPLPNPLPKEKVKKLKKIVDNVTENEDDLSDITDRKIRSFKVKLPNKEEYEGRFTGLTPYQAANKALSKYFRETQDPLSEVTFSICESTRKSKKTTYTYVGKRQKLDVPVSYIIQDGREITKNFKNFLKKVKKSELVVSE